MNLRTSSMKKPTSSKLKDMIKSRGYTDRLYFLNLKFTWFFVLICIFITLLSGVLNISDLSLISYGIPAVFGELAIHTGMVIWKAKAENIRKYGKLVDEEGDI